MDPEKPIPDTTVPGADTPATEGKPDLERTASNMSNVGLTPDGRFSQFGPFSIIWDLQLSGFYPPPMK